MAAPRVRTRLLEAQDIPACVKLYREAYQAPPYGHGWGDDTATLILEDMRRLFPQECFVAEVDGQLVGFILCSSLAGLRGTVEEFAVAPGYQRQGIGRMMLRHVLAHFRRRGVPFVELVANVDAPAYRFYLHEGFTECQTYRLMSKEL